MLPKYIIMSYGSQIFEIVYTFYIYKMHCSEYNCNTPVA